jgi:hypothetical protein
LLIWNRFFEREGKRRSQVKIQHQTNKIEKEKGGKRRTEEEIEGQSTGQPKYLTT